MPHYDYSCTQCGHQLEDVFQKITEEPLKECPSCSQLTLKRAIGGGNAAFQFKGSGFYLTDYCKKSSSTPSEGGCGCKGTHSCS